MCQQAKEMDLAARLGTVPGIGYILICITSIMVMIVSFIVKILESVDPFIIALFRSLIILFLASLRCLIGRSVPFLSKNTNVKLFLRGFLGAFGLIGKFYATRHMAIGDSTIIFTSVPVFETFFARIFLKEPCGAFEVLILTICLLGILFVLQPAPIFWAEDLIDQDSVNYNSPLGITAAIISVFGQSTAGVLTRSLKDVPLNIITWWSGLCITLGAICCCLIFDVDWEAALCPELSWTVFIGFLSYFSVSLNSLIYRFEDAGFASLMRKSTDVLFGYGIQVLYFGDVPSLLTSVGVLIIVSSVLFSGVRKIVSKKSLFSESIQKFIFCIPMSQEDSKKCSEMEEGPQAK